MAVARRGQAPANGISPRSGRRAPRVGVVLLALSGLFFGVNFAQAWWTTHEYQRQADQLRAKISAQRAQNAQLQSELPYFSTKEYIVSSAREYYGYANRGDTVLIVNKGAAPTKTVYVHATPKPPENVVTRLLHAIFQ